MPKKDKDKSKEIAISIARWHKEQTVAQFFKEKMGEDGNANKIANNIISKSLAEEKPEWTRLLMDTMKVGDDKKPEGGQSINFFTLASNQINSAVQSLIDVTPKKKVKTGIQNII